MCESGDFNNGNPTERSAVYIYSPDYVETCDSLSKVPNRVSSIFSPLNTMVTSYTAQHHRTIYSVV